MGKGISLMVCNRETKNRTIIKRTGITQSRKEDTSHLQGMGAVICCNAIMGRRT